MFALLFLYDVDSSVIAKLIGQVQLTSVFYLQYFLFLLKCLISVIHWNKINYRKRNAKHLYTK